MWTQTFLASQYVISALAQGAIHCPLAYITAATFCQFSLFFVPEKPSEQELDKVSTTVDIFIASYLKKQHI